MAHSPAIVQGNQLRGARAGVWYTTGLAQQDPGRTRSRVTHPAWRRARGTLCDQSQCHRQTYRKDDTPPASPWQGGIGRAEGALRDCHKGSYRVLNAARRLFEKREVGGQRVILRSDLPTEVSLGRPLPQITTSQSQSRRFGFPNRMAPRFPRPVLSQLEFESLVKPHRDASVVL